MFFKFQKSWKSEEELMKKSFQLILLVSITLSLIETFQIKEISLWGKDSSYFEPLRFLDTLCRFQRISRTHIIIPSVIDQYSDSNISEICCIYVPSSSTNLPNKPMNQHYCHGKHQNIQHHYKGHIVIIIFTTLLHYLMIRNYMVAM